MDTTFIIHAPHVEDEKIAPHVEDLKKKHLFYRFKYVF